MVAPPLCDTLDSQRWQAVASIPGERFEHHLAEEQTAGRRVVNRSKDAAQLERVPLCGPRRLGTPADDLGLGHSADRAGAPEAELLDVDTIASGPRSVLPLAAILPEQPHELGRGVSSITAAKRLIGCFQRHWHTNWHTPACRSLSGRETVGRVHAENPYASSECLAERVGFEPTVAINHTAFRERHLQPLGHLSGAAASIGSAAAPGPRNRLRWRCGS
jgi:hypothetical protein